MDQADSALVTVIACILQLAELGLEALAAGRLVILLAHSLHLGWAVHRTHPVPCA